MVAIKNQGLKIVGTLTGFDFISFYKDDKVKTLPVAFHGTYFDVDNLILSTSIVLHKDFKVGKKSSANAPKMLFNLSLNIQSMVLTVKNHNLFEGETNLSEVYAEQCLNEYNDESIFYGTSLSRYCVNDVMIRLLFSSCLAKIELTSNDDLEKAASNNRPYTLSIDLENTLPIMLSLVNALLLRKSDVYSNIWLAIIETIEEQLTK